MRTTAVAVALVLAAAPMTGTAADSSDVAFPEGYRAWSHVKSMVINEGHPLYEAVGGLHNIYANPDALRGYRGDESFADGSVIVFDLFEAVDADHAIAEGKRKAVIVMEKNSAYGNTDGWGYQVFDPATKQPTLDAKGAADCHGCHTGQKAEDFVFSAWRE
jgi:hypothetical protein